MQSTLVMKLGGAAVATPANFFHCAAIIKQRLKEYSQLVVVVSAMQGMTDQLINLAKQINEEPQPREYDMLLSVGERISMSLLAMALAKEGCEAVSFTGSQSGIITCDQYSDAKIIEVRPHRLLPHFNKNRVVIVAGFQGVSQSGEITTLGRGGSDTTAVALALALQADRVEFYKDVEGLFSEDPKKNIDAKLFHSLTYKKAAALLESGGKILHKRCVQLAECNALELHVRSFKSFFECGEKVGTRIFDSSLKTPAQPVYEKQKEHKEYAAY